MRSQQLIIVVASVSTFGILAHPLTEDLYRSVLFFRRYGSTEALDPFKTRRLHMAIVELEKLVKEVQLLTVELEETYNLSDRAWIVDRVTDLLWVIEHELIEEV
jgi:hypothetical protein